MRVVWRGRRTWCAAVEQRNRCLLRPARGAALCALAGDLPAPVLAEVLGLSVSAATGWVAVAARDEAHYLLRPEKRPGCPSGLDAAGSGNGPVSPLSQPFSGSVPVSSVMEAGQGVPDRAGRAGNWAIMRYRV